jgi:hypothetical protein
MDGLIATPFTSDAAVAFAANACFVTVRYNNDDGTHHLIQVPAGGGLLAGHSLQANDVVAITSANGHVVTITISGPSLFSIVLTGKTSDPLVDARQPDGRRRYVISNAGNISTVTYTQTSIGTTTQLFPDPGFTTSIFTMVHFGVTAPTDKAAVHDKESIRDRR